MAEFIDTHRGGKAMLYEWISALFERFKEGQYSLSDFLDAINIKLDFSLSTCAFVVFIVLFNIKMISWQVDFVRVDLVAIDLMRID